MSDDPQGSAARAQRQRLMALTPYPALREAWRALDIDPVHRRVRGPESGMAMVRGRVGGEGRAFNLGEMTMCRASVALDDEAGDAALGHAWLAGRDHRQVELMALIDACAQRPTLAARIERELMAPLAAALARRRELESRKVAATRVEFFTLARTSTRGE
ncbi:phosphonate C-P lyase system protein PhnG [Halotalea alkalilenta]|uniref:Phosphonate C-P lyase system protein PhnG n=1 Tax=Halotalea alkalilenta TaxID=376489 RepID=A0A172YDM7_9GAMM|nr:phosphonate C-P lyase system protein PhnG [Halotalea alkalilenta]ANF57359.1 phosphonate C-P lyase system protein PhnG [Halotalea alkalilenta]